MKWFQRKHPRHFTVDEIAAMVAELPESAAKRYFGNALRMSHSQLTLDAIGEVIMEDSRA